MKAVLHYRAGPNLRAMLQVFPQGLSIAIVEPSDGAALDREMADADMLLHVLEPVSAEIMDKAPKLRLIQKIGVGVDAIEIAHARSRGIAVCNMPGTNTAAVAEMTLALMLACLRRVVQLSVETSVGKGWLVSGEIGDSLVEIGGRTIGLIGYGAVPQRLVPVLKALGARVIAFSRPQQDDGVEFMPLDDLLRTSDLVSLHLPATDETKHLIDARRTGLMKPGSILINTARGSLIDENALADALGSGQRLDVFASEPPGRENPLLSLHNVVATPHIAWLTQETLRRSLDVVIENSRRLETGGALLNRI